MKKQFDNKKETLEQKKKGKIKSRNKAQPNRQTDRQVVGKKVNIKYQCEWCDSEYLYQS